MNLTQLSAEIKSRIDGHSASVVEEPRWHLGASEIGDECLRRVWYKFRWVAFEVFSGRMRRLFARGHSEETKLAALLQAIGFQVSSIDPATGKQYLGSIIAGHYGGSSDGKTVASPVGLDLPPLQLEYKTHKNSSFLDLVKHGLIKSKPKHYVQMCVYGKFNQLQYGLYVAVNKDTDDLHIQLIELDFDVADNAERKAEAIIFGKTPPDKVNNKPAFYLCKMCNFNKVCHHGEAAVVNCRSCSFAMPTRDGNASWHCSKWDATIPKEHAISGCGEWRSVLND